MIRVAGKIELREHGDTNEALFLSDSDRPLAERLADICGKQVTARYWTASEEADAETIKEEFVKKLCGAADVRFDPRYSEYTGYLWTDEDLVIGGHDLINELSYKEHLGRWLVLEIEIA